MSLIEHAEEGFEGRWTRPRRAARCEQPAIRAINEAASPTRAEVALVDALRADAWIDGLPVVTLAADGSPVAHTPLTRRHVGDALT